MISKQSLNQADGLGFTRFCGLQRSSSV